MRLATLAIVTRLAPVTLVIEDQEIHAVSIFAIPALRATSSTRPLYLP
jgi:acid stress-induced BolA-like protein IbaG/YrbA